MNGTVSDLSIVFMAISCLFGFGLPIVLLLYFRKKFKADFMAFVVGGAVMFLFALVLEATALPLSWRQRSIRSFSRPLPERQSLAAQFSMLFTVDSWQPSLRRQDGFWP